MKTNSTACKKAKEVTAYLGLNPRHHQSGGSVRDKTRMSNGRCTATKCPVYACTGCLTT
ncbi:transposase [Klebsiella aerogenes]